MKESAEQRSRTMRAVKSSDTSPEIAVRRCAHSMGYRYRLHLRSLPGNPDLAFPARRKAILVHGCFWHGHACARGHRLPETNRSYWKAKIARNVTRDRETLKALSALGWRALIIWECESKDTHHLRSKVRTFLGR